ncbi:MAG: prolipoprotein diacylglyceryl transferase [bacterium]|nr:prolipoprotein diacylglyceryl transferase [bacterium]
MHPDLFSIGPLTLHAYGTALAISFLLGLLFARYRARTRGIEERDVFDLFQLIIISAIVGSRILFVVFHLDAYEGRWLHMFSLWEGGLTLYGGILLCFLTSWLFMSKRKISFLGMADVMTPSIGLGIMITRIGCFLNGCCYGLPTHSHLGVCFPPHSEANRTALSLLARNNEFLEAGACATIHPAQLYSSLGGLIILAVLLLLERKGRPVGFTFANFLFVYGLHRFSVDQFRYYEEVMRVLGLSVNQWLSIGFIISSILLHVFLARARRTASQAVPVDTVNEE